ncbi:MAG: LysR substrate-binding domain-containing protein [Pseudomonadota bacterium]
MGMDIKLLEAFRTVMDNQSVTGAARILGLTQPAVSAQIARLESQVGFELFERTGGRLKATEQGRRFYGEVCTALESLDALGKTASNIRSGETEALTVASHPGSSTSLMPGVVARLFEQQPNARVSLINRTSEEVARIFEAGGADIGIAEWPIHIQGVELRRYEIPCVVILPPRHPLADKTVLAPDDLSGKPFIAMSETRLIGHRIKALFGDSGAQYAPIADSEYFSTICGLVAAGCGVSIVDLISAVCFEAMGLTIRRFEPALKYEIGVFRRAVPTPLSDKLLDLIDGAIHAASRRTETGEAAAAT